MFLRDADGVAIGCLCVNSLQRFLVDRAIAKVGVPTPEMKMHHKAAVVRELDEAGFFLIRDSVDLVASQLEVTRYTIYDYLNEIRG
ncbi:helix-turn-helix domain-containing protein [Mycobacterium yunnanensis]|uniref:helix-turn-helix domain-containing protein n=1 Tax=Mycobacterium yunnanensis TaxID=368477 RepID=UPI0021F36EB1|nr:helix-turn-helix domain-containing protein [Mycobacterium yunnanensis]